MNINNKYPQVEFNLNGGNIQLKMNLNTEIYVEDDVKLRLVQNIIERLDLEELKKLYSKDGRKPAVDPITLLKILIYSYSDGVFSSRKIEEKCKYDVRMMYLLNDTKAPDHSTINRFRQKIKQILPNISIQITNLLIENNLIDLSSIYIDGTKIESRANKYTFIWRGTIEKYQEKLRNKAIKKYNLSEETTIKDIRKIVKKEFTSISNKCKKEKIVFVKGQGKRKSSEQKEYELLKDWNEKLKRYKKDLEIMGERNSYSKTDKDATFMRMKDDHFKNGQLKPAYNIQLATTGGYIIGQGVYSNPSDMYTLKPFIKKIHKNHPNKLDKIVADSGYESEENYTYLEEKNLRAFIKPSNYEKSKTRKYKKEQEYRKSLKYNEKEDMFISPEGKKFIRVKDRHTKKKSGFIAVTKVYKCLDWNTNGQKTKGIYISENFIKYRKKSLENITSKEGIEERINRSIQAEGAFSKLKDGLKYSRFHHIGKENIESEITLMSIAININTLTSRLVREEYDMYRYTISEKQVA